MTNSTKRSASGVVFIGLVLTLTTTAQESSVNVISAKKRVGEVVTLCGQVVDYGCSQPFTTLGLAPSTDPMPFDILLVDDDRSRFGARPEESFLNRVICVRGRVETRPSGYRISVVDPALMALATDQPGNPTPPFAPDAYSACDSRVTPPKVRRRIQPKYTAQALAAEIQGSVLFRAVVKVDGTVGEMQVLRALDRGLDLEALRAFGRWTFEPGTYQGKPVPVVVTGEMTFTMDR